MDNEGTAVALAEPESRAVAPVTEAPGSLLAAIVGMAKDPAVDVQKLKELLAMQERMEARQAEREFTAAFIRLQTRLPIIKKDGQLKYPVDKKNPDGPQRLISKFARWEDILEAIMPMLREEGFALSFDTAERQGGGLWVIAILEHAAGHQRRARAQGALDTSGGKNDLQGYGSTQSYGQRNATRALLNLRFEGEDDDGKLGGTKFVTTEQAAEIDTLLRETGTNPGKFLEYFEVSDVRNLTAENFTPAKNMLLSKRKRAEK